MITSCGKQLRILKKKWKKKKSFSYSGTKSIFRQARHTLFTVELLKSKIANGDSQLYINILEGATNLKNLNLSHIQQQFLFELKQGTIVRKNIINRTVTIKHIKQGYKK